MSHGTPHLVYDFAFNKLAWGAIVEIVDESDNLFHTGVLGNELNKYNELVISVLLPEGNTYRARCTGWQAQGQVLND